MNDAMPQESGAPAGASVALNGASDRPWLRRYAKLVVALTLLLIFFGGQVKSHEAGLAVPDWPLTFGENPITFPLEKWTGGIFHEHFHRLFAGTVACLTLIQAIWLQASGCAGWLKKAGWLAVAAVLAQALLGGLTVWMALPVAVSSSHAILAQTFLLINIVIAYGLSRERQRRIATPAEEPPHDSTLRQAVIVVLLLIYGQLFLGATMRHMEAGLAIPDFPTTAGRVVPRLNEESLQWVNAWRFGHTNALDQDLPPVSMGQMVIHFSHRTGALVVTVAIVMVTVVAARLGLRERKVLKTCYGLCGLLTLQLLLGMFTIWSRKEPLYASLHVMIGAAVLGFTMLLLLRLWPVHRINEAPAAAHGQAPATAPHG